APAEDFEVKAGEIDQETFDALIAEGKSERIARSKAKSAYVKKEKARLRAEAEAAGGDASEPAGDAGSEPSAPKAAEIHVEAGQIDQETFDALIAEGKPERMARAKAKAAYVKKEKARLRAEAESGEGEAEAAPEAEVAPDADADAEPEAAAPEAAGAKKLSDVHVEGSGEIDQETYDALIAEGKSERIARAKAKAAWVKKRKQQLLDQENDA
ncbi:MAG: hypothetical protein WD670_03645, partial [Actinomycetota bacterium]